MIVCDAAYHKAKKAALAEGQAPEEACEAGKEASRKTGEKVDKGELVEE